MKRLILSVSLLCLVIWASVSGLNFVNRTYKEVTDAITQSEQALRSGDEKSAKECSERAEKIYVKAERYLAAFVNHSTLDEIGVNLASISPFVEGDDKSEFFSHTAEAKTSLKHLKNDIEISIKNLF